MHQRTSPWGLVVAIAAVLALLAAGCGSGRSDDEGATPGSTDTTASADGEGMFGTLESPCGEGDATGATAQGVTDTEIKIGYGDDAGYQASPGLNHEMSDAVAAMIDWCNEQGGINGRQVLGTYYDAKITEVTNVMTEACGSEFFLVGEGFALDSAQETVRRGCDLPAVAGYTVSPQFTNAPNHWEPLPIPSDYFVTSNAAQLAEMFPEKITKSAVVYANYAATIDTKDRVLASFPEYGYEFLDCPQEYNIGGEADWKPFAQRLKDCGAEFVYFSGSPHPNFENLLTAADQIGFDPVWTTDPNFYDYAFADWNVNGWADDVYFRDTFIPLEEADTTPAVQQYIDIVEASGGDTSLLGQSSTSAFLLWATAAKECGSDLTRECVAEKLDATTEWDGGGLHGVSNPGENLPSDCGILIKLTGTEFERVTPPERGSMPCDPDWVVELSGPVVDRANLDENRISQL